MQPVESPTWVNRYRKFIVALGGAVLEAAALWQDAHPALVGGIAFVTAAIVAAIRNVPEPI